MTNNSVRCVFLTHVIKPVGNLLIHLVTYGYCESQKYLRNESCDSR